MRAPKLAAVVTFAIFLAGCAADRDPAGQQTGMAQGDVPRYVAAMSEQPGQLAHEHQCGHDRSWTRLEGLSTDNE
jgi:hypothetical protein